MLSKDQQECYDAICKGKNLFITARAGAGKSYLINYIIENIKKSIILCASTGISATIIGGRTLHSQFLISNEQNAEESAMQIRASEKRYNKIKKSKIIIIDEISMVSDKLLDCIDNICRIIREKPNKAFGGLQVIFCGDFLQLPPVFRGNNSDSTYCVYSKAWRDANIRTFLLTTNFRQENDVEFFDILTRIRYNCVNQKTIDILKKRELEPNEKVIRLYSTNNEVDNYNDLMFEKLNKKTTHKYRMTIDGEQSIVNNFLKNSLFEEVLELRQNARVMLLVNKEVDNKYFCNGSLGTVIGFNDNLPIVEFDNGETLVIDNYVMQQFEKVYNDNGEVENGKELLYMEQIPLKLAYAISIHKSQGQTFDSVYVDCSKIFTYGQVYVALSRCKKLDGLFIKNFNANKSRCQPEMVDWYIKIEKENKLNKEQNNDK